MIIVEGPDGTGKTTLAKKIAEEYSLEYRRPPMLSSTKGPADASIYDWWKQEMRTDDDRAVYDRCFFISEMIYQLATPERELLVDGYDFALGVEDLMMMQPFIVFCLPKWEKTLPILTSGREMLEGMSIKAAEKVHWAYWGVYGMWYPTVTNVHVHDFHANFALQEQQILISVGKYLARRKRYGS